jgi:hypothetical protein
MHRHTFKFRRHILKLTALSVLISILGNIGIAFAADGEVLSEQKISDSAGSFATTLDNDDDFGTSVAVIGDLDNDGNDDVVVGAPEDDDGATGNGAVYILFLDSDGTVKSEQKISDTAGDFTATFDGGDEFGYSVAGIGDVDGDTIEDIAVGADRADDNDNGNGSVFIIYLGTDGKSDGFHEINDSNMTGSPLDANDYFGSGVANIGDVNNDGNTDLAVGAYFDDDGLANNGAIYIIFLTSSGTYSSHEKISDTNGDFTATFSSGMNFGQSVGVLGDIDGDTVEDVVVGAPLDDDGGTSRGAAYIIFLGTDGKADGFAKISDTAGDFTGAFDNGDRFGYAVSGVGDIDGDTIGDVAVGAAQDDDGDSAAGALYIIFLGTDGKSDGFQKISDTSGGLTENLGAGDQFGTAIAQFTDLDGDNKKDIIVGAYQDDDGGNNRGAVYVLNLDGLEAGGGGGVPFFHGPSLALTGLILFIFCFRYQHRLEEIFGTR